MIYLYKSQRPPHFSFFSILSWLFVFFCYFPYLKVIPLPVDSQPYALVFGSLIVLFYNKSRIKVEFKILGFVCAFSFLGLMDNVTFNALRSIMNYVSILIVPWATFIILSHKRLSFAMFKFVVFAWGVMGLIHLLINPTFGGALLYRAYNGVVNTGRGATSFAPEATFYGIICMFLMLIGYMNFRIEKNYKLWMWAIFLQLILISRSSMSIFVVIISISLYLLIKGLYRRPMAVLAGVFGLALIVLGINAFQEFLSDYRAGRHLIKFIHTPGVFITSDNSINERFIHAFFPLIGFIEDFGLPHFYDQFNTFMKQIYFSWEWMDYISYYRNDYTRIMSGVGSALYELGWVGALIYCVLFKDIYIIAKRDFRYWLVGILFFCIMLNAMPLTNGMVGFAFGNIIYRRYYPLNS